MPDWAKSLIAPTGAVVALGGASLSGVSGAVLALAGLGLIVAGDRWKARPMELAALAALLVTPVLLSIVAFSGFQVVLLRQTGPAGTPVSIGFENEPSRRIVTPLGLGFAVAQMPRGESVLETECGDRRQGVAYLAGFSGAHVITLDGCRVIDARST